MKSEHETALPYLAKSRLSSSVNWNLDPGLLRKHTAGCAKVGRQQVDDKCAPLSFSKTLLHSERLPGCGPLKSLIYVSRHRLAKA